jgi:hypothetical protein
MGSNLTVTNPYLREPAVRERTVLKSVATSSAIEGIRAPFRRAADFAGKADESPRRGIVSKSRATRS